MILDQGFAMDIMSSYSQGLDIATFAPDDLKTLDDYLPVRSLNSGLDVTADMACFVNDLYSWPKENKCHLETPGSNPPFNAVAVLMRHGGYSESEAFQVLYDKQAELEEEHIRLLEALRQKEGRRLPENQELYIANAQQAVSGLELWSIFTTRYPSKADLQQAEVEFVDGKFGYVREGREVDGARPEYDNMKHIQSDVIREENFQDSLNITIPRQGHGRGRMKALLPDGPEFPTYASRVAAAPDHAAVAPFKYIASLPSKGIRDTFIDALNWWLAVPEDSLRSIKTIISMLHDSSLM
ncbi:Fusicoccadiene synthase 2 [Colletotrichum chlorophyti]|uniref:Fusicoccadiene synthase 2 n=1 Tax=Colletotrichum chlorophyti TaxID=708187 RepID=A0A1Q8RT23_9PEZI|nr:Fusicoccadiene synthase 2 [Colletotrichum chlorophyti]